MNIDEFLAPVSAEQPCGENLEYDADFQAMEQAMQGKAEQQFGDTIIPAEPADWTTVEKLAAGLLSRTKDLRVMLALTQAWTKRRGLSGYADGLLLVQQALSLYWQPIYPLLEEYGETDPFYRINALAGLSDKSALTSALRNAVLLRSNGDELLLRDAQALLDGSKTECADYPGGRSRLIDELARGGQPGIDAILAIHQRLQTIREILCDCLGESGVPEMEQLQKTVGIVAGACQITDISSFHASREESAVSEHQAIPDALAPSAVDWRSAQISSRAEAQQMLEKVKQYFAQHEPSHPAPLMIERVQRLIELDFMDIIRDLAPDGVHQLENIFGRRD
ncbi:type VI secretion system protein TssA [Klebsiella aerogenes]|uniref:type VI secretion system protein TssA n=1 Tax=Klebsiella aerogenes TaxID=548 RepID=UPI000650562E|nr:type VI secretion system protein TssA [Klebsiella aerogenes]ATX87877.1 type VI secretion system protein TssA [Klebsiella aerogenes]ELA1894214.1 type VI secretion system protein TssA [Klebsiella aerogenes]KLW01661.1 ImpA family type VI secretion-associated protein [Klebsiella aerogenes]KLW33044.1 ImpA family type VI secretion-associated protein [Klebsiella aerogenes]MBK0631641.1 type VI secretion system protein TssA [Klebsiella aerogenes]